MTDAYVHVTVDAGSVSDAARQIAEVDAVSDVHVVTGEFDVIAQVDLEDPDDLPHVVADDIHAAPGVADTVTNVAYEP